MDKITEYWEDRVKQGLEGVGYLGLGEQYNRWLYRVRRHVFLSHAKYISGLSHARVLDVGSGAGFYIDRWRELGVLSITGIDITNTAVESLTGKYPNDTFFKLDIGGHLGTLIFLSFDIVSAFDVLFHIVDDARLERAIQNIYRQLKPGGAFIFSDNFLHGQTARSEYQVSRSLREIEGILRATGFRIIDRVPMFVLMNNPVDSNSILLKKLWRLMARIISLHEIFGFLIGALLYPIELLCVSFMRESPTTEMMICRKEGST